MREDQRLLDLIISHAIKNENTHWNPGIRSNATHFINSFELREGTTFSAVITRIKKEHKPNTSAGRTIQQLLARHHQAQATATD
eukprot:gnl/Chilomastix_caulleri/5122.p2 GENE.gnl/Chilomastix_caulleri/5122~~gnl/Chilomastix_caulleri/5122.p2  ORF type:complete len:84 (+),score=17.22 gnl/Chilomastix_caulleri/5122:295-546(+)